MAAKKNLSKKAKTTGKIKKKNAERWVSDEE